MTLDGKKIVAWVVCAACIGVISAAAVAQNLRLDLDSPFYRTLRLAPMPDDPVMLLVTARLFNRAQNGTEGVDLARWLDRTRLQELLEEPMPAPGPRTVGEAIAAERSAKEPFETLRRRALDSQLSLERAAGSKADDFQYNGRIAYIGNAVWQGGATNRRVWMRVKVASHSSHPIDIFGFAITLKTDTRGLMEFWRCTLEGGGSLEPAAIRYAICANDVDIDKSPAAVNAIAADDFALPLRVIRIETRDLRLMTSGDTLPANSDWGDKATRRADEILAREPCERLNSCAQVAKQQANDAQRKYFQSAEYFEKQRMERRERGQKRVGWGLALLLALTVGFALLPEREEDPDVGWGGGIAAFVIFSAGTLVIACAKAILEEASYAQSYGGYIVIIVGAGAALVVTCLLLWLGLTLRDREHRTRTRLAALGFGLGSLGIFSSMFVP